MRIVVFGASGRTGRLVVERALAAGHEVVAFVRDAAAFDGASGSLDVVEGDLLDPAAVRRAVEGADAVVNVVGHGRDTPSDLLERGGENVLAAMRDAGVDRYVVVAGAGVRTTADPPSLGGRVMGLVMRVAAPGVVADARRHVEAVTDSDLAWTVVRPPRLTDGAETGAFRTGYLSLGPFDSLSRADLAAFLVRAVEEDEWVAKAPHVAN